MVLSVCQRLLHDVQASEDAFQATFLALVREARYVARREALGGWLYTVAYRVALKAKGRAARRAAQEKAGLAIPEAVTPEDTSVFDLRPLLDEEINRLPEKYRRPVVLCYLQGKTNTEAARQLGCPPGTIATRLTWARERLRRRLTQRGVTLSAGALAAVFGGGKLQAVLPGPLVNLTVRVGLAGTMGRIGVTSAYVTTLAQGAMHMLFLNRLKKMVLIVAVAGVLVAGAGVGSYRAMARRVGQPTAQEAPPPQSSARADGGKDEARLNARQALGEAFDLVRAVKDAAERVDLLTQPAIAQTEAGDRAGGIKTLRDALNAAHEIRDETPKGMALREIAEAQVRVKDVPAALRTAEEIQDSWRKNHLLFLIASQQAAVGDMIGAMQTAEGITDDQKDSALAAVAVAQAETGNVKTALQIADRLKHQPLSRASALEAIALAQAKAGDRAAGVSLQEALRLQTATLAQENDRIAMRTRIAILQARLGDVSGAFAAAAAFPDNKEGGSVQEPGTGWHCRGAGPRR